MSAKDPRKAIALCVPDTARAAFVHQRRLSRSGSGAGVVRRMVEQGLALGFTDHGVEPGDAGQVYRVQLPQPVLCAIQDLSVSHGQSVHHVITQLLVSAAIGPK